MKTKTILFCIKCGRNTWRQPDKNGDVICAICNKELEEQTKLIRSIIKDYLIELGVINE